MCGIIGYWALEGEREPLRHGLERAIATLKHRGPDSSGMWRDGAGVSVGHTRLSILDLTGTGAQPMVDADARNVIVFNGEVYNFRELANELTAKGHKLLGNSDTEVVLAAYREWGPACVERFIGMFAFAIWDGARQRLSLCRDRVGVKPLHYGWDGHVLCFASELKALRALPHWQNEIDPAALGEFLQYGYISAPRTIYRHIRKLPPGCWLHAERGRAPRIEPYWTLSSVRDRGHLEGNARELEAALEELLESACRYRMVSDVPVGLFLSGGIDSSLVAGILKSCGIELKTYTIGFKSARHDESQAAANVAASLGFENHSLVVDEEDAWSILSFWPDLYDEPFGDPSGIPTYIVARLAREHVKVALSADGGDELFCGYSGYVGSASRLKIHQRIPAWVRSVGARGLNLAAELGPMDLGARLAANVHQSFGEGLVLDRLHKMNGYLGAASGVDALRPFRTFWQSREVRRLLGPTYRDPREGTLDPKGSPIEQVAAVDFNEYLPDDVLAKVDRATMAVGLEGREPLLDHRVVEFAMRLPPGLRHGPLGNKHILRSILYRHVPRELVDRPKQGFAVPLSAWMERLITGGAVREASEIVTEKLGLDTRYLEGALRTFAGSAQGKNRLWLLYVLGQWARRWL